jgi:hypothetical protein
MVDSIDDFAAENRRKIKRSSGRFIQVNPDRERNFSFGKSFVTFDVTADIQTRGTGDQAVFGHPDESKGFGRGTFGDDRGEFTNEDQDIPAAVLSSALPDIGEAFTTPKRGVTGVGFGYGDDDPDRRQDGLGDRAATSKANTESPSNRIGVRGVFNSTDVVDGDGFEVSADTFASEVLVRATASTDVDTTEDIRVVFDIELSGSGLGSSLFTDVGEAVLTNAIQGDTVVDRFAYSNGPVPDTATEELPNTAFTTSANTIQQRNAVRVDGKVEAGDPPSSFTEGTVSVVAIVADTDDVIWATPIRDVTVSDETAFANDMKIVFA